MGARGIRIVAIGIQVSGASETAAGYDAARRTRLDGLAETIDGNTERLIILGGQVHVLRRADSVHIGSVAAERAKICLPTRA